MQNDEFLADGPKLFNPTRPHGTIYGEGGIEGRFVQDGLVYRGDGRPVGYVETPADQKTLKLKV